jgi:selenide,water dikinase
VHEGDLWTNGGARPGDALVITKPLGTGVITTALKRGECPPESEAAAVEAMAALNRAAAVAARPHQVHSCTDVTGFGLIGHAWEMARTSGARLVIESAAAPLLPGAVEMATAGHLTRGDKSNRRYVGEALSWGDVAPALQSVLADPQTSGGLLFALPEAGAAALVAAGVGWRIGRVEAGEAAIRVE